MSPPATGGDAWSRHPFLIAGILFAAVIICVLACCGANRWRNDREDAKADRAVEAYLEDVRDMDYHAAYELLCPDARYGYTQADHVESWPVSLTSFAIESATDWSSWVDGHGIVYRVRLTYADGTQVTDDLVVQQLTSGPCIDR